MGINKVAASWGFAEATLFFIVPDVWLSIVARKDLKKGLIACFYSLAGALLGGAILFWWGLNDVDSASTIIEMIPAINHDMLARVQLDLSEQGLSAVMLGPLSGTPYKVYAINAANTEASIWLFLLISIPARLVRFIIVVACSHYLSQLITNKTKLNPLMIIICFWLLFYGGYFYIMSH